jgi:hypothetical protein
VLFGRPAETAFRQITLVDLVVEDEFQNRQDEEQHGQRNGHVEQSLLDAAASGKNRAGIGTGQPAQACALALLDHACNQGHGGNDQSNIKISIHSFFCLLQI